MTKEELEEEDMSARKNVHPMKAKFVQILDNMRKRPELIDPMKL